MSCTEVQSAGRAATDIKLGRLAQNKEPSLKEADYASWLIGPPQFRLERV
jgi:hypothetical protein